MGRNKVEKYNIGDIITISTYPSERGRQLGRFDKICDKDYQVFFIDDMRAYLLHSDIRFASEGCYCININTGELGYYRFREGNPYLYFIYLKYRLDNSIKTTSYCDYKWFMACNEEYFEKSTLYHDFLHIVNQIRGKRLFTADEI